MAHRLRCLATCGPFLDQGSDLSPLHWRANTHPLSPQGSPYSYSHTVSLVRGNAVSVQGHGLWNPEGRFSILTPSLTGYVTSGKLLNLEPPLDQSRIEMNTSDLNSHREYSLRDCLENTWGRSDAE